MFLVLAFLVLLFQNAFTAKVPICRSMEYSLKTTATTKDNTPKEDESPPTFYSYNFNMDVTVSPDFPEFPNKITIYNFTEFSLDDSLYFRASPPQFFIDKGFQYNSTTSPSTMTGPWIYYSPNGEVTTAIEYYHQKMSFGNITDQMGIYLNKGRFYKIGGYVMDPKTDKCMTSTGDRDNVSYSYSACCNHFDYVKIPDKFEDPCLEYKTNGRISYQFEEVNVKFSVHYTVTFDGQLKMEISIEDAPKVAYQYFLKFNEDKICEGSQKVHARTCTYKLPFFQEDFEMDIRFAFFTDAQSPIMTTIGGLNRRNGIWLKAGNTPFTPKKPCSHHNSTLPFIYATSEASFCCAKFKNPTTTSTTTTTTTTTAPATNGTTTTPTKLEAKSSGSNTFSYVMTFMFLAACTAGVIFGIHKYYHRRPGPQYTTMGPDL